MNRRVFGAAAIAGTGALAVRRMLSTGSLQDRRKPRSRVAIIHQDSYAYRLDQTLLEGLRLFNLDLSGKRVLLKPNLVESIPGSEVNTNPRLVGAAATAFLALWANSPGGRRARTPAGHDAGSRGDRIGNGAPGEANPVRGFEPR